MKHIEFTEYLRSAVVALLCLLALGGVAATRDFVVTLDAGHGGHDYGAVGSASNEKSITLAVVRRLGDLIEKNLKDVKVVYTRKTDVFIPLNDRAAIANKAGSDLFISVHINSVDKRNRNRANIEGCQVYTLGLHKTAENLAVAKRENAVMELEADHTEKYAGFDPNSLESDIVFELSQNRSLDRSIEFADAIHRELSTTAGRTPKGVRQAGFWVLWATSMPSVLVELDFICNPKSEKFMRSDDGQERFAISIYNALCAYINTYGSQITGRNLPLAKALTPSGAPSKAYGISSAQELESVADSGNSSGKTPAGTEKLPSKAVAPAQPAGPLEPVNGIKPVKESGKERFFVQLVASSTPLTPDAGELRGISDVQYYREGGFYKYVTGNCRSLNAARKLQRQLSSRFPDSFIVGLRKGERTRFVKP